MQRIKVATKVVEMVQHIRLQMPRIGTRKLFELLLPRLKPMKVGRDRLFSILRANNLLINPKRTYHVTTNSHHRFRKHKNKIEGLVAQRPEEIWVLALVTDAYSKKIVGYNVSKSLNSSGSIKALRMAVKSRMYKTEQLIHHSDRGLQYCSDEYQKVLGSNGIICSMTESYDPYANAIAERINGILKQEFIGQLKTTDIKIMRELVKDSIKIYNQKRPHYSCYMKTPEMMHRQKQIRIRTYKKRKPAEHSQQVSII